MADPTFFQAFVTVTIENTAESEKNNIKRIEEALNGTKVLTVAGSEVIKFQVTEHEGS